MRLIVLGIGRAGGSMALAAKAAGHELVGLVARPDARLPPPLEPYRVGGDLPPADLALIASRDRQILEAAQELAGLVGDLGCVAHLSGFTSVEVLSDLFDPAVATGSMHPLQTLPNPVTGSQALRGAYAAITGSASPTLSVFAGSLGMVPFAVEDGEKPAYHAAASAAANFLTEALAVADDLLVSVGSSLAVTRPLVDAIIENVFERGWGQSITGPVARGDVATVAGQIAAADALSDRLGSEYRHLVAALATRLGRHELIP